MNPQTIKLVSLEHTQDEIGQDIEIKHYNEVTADIRSISSSFKEEVAKRGIFLEWQVMVWNFEYSNEEYVELNDITYKVYSTYHRDDGKVELNLHRAVGLDG